MSYLQDIDKEEPKFIELWKPLIVHPHNPLNDKTVSAIYTFPDSTKSITRSMKIYCDGSNVFTKSSEKKELFNLFGFSLTYDSNDIKIMKSPPRLFMTLFPEVIDNNALYNISQSMTINGENFSDVFVYTRDGKIDEIITKMNMYIHKQ